MDEQSITDESQEPQDGKHLESKIAFEQLAHLRGERNRLGAELSKNAAAIRKCVFNADVMFTRNTLVGRRAKILKVSKSFVREEHYEPWVILAVYRRDGKGFLKATVEVRLSELRPFTTEQSQ